MQQWVQTRIAHIYDVTNVIILIIGRPIGILRHLWLIVVISGIFSCYHYLGFWTQYSWSGSSFWDQTKIIFPSIKIGEEREGEGEIQYLTFWSASLNFNTYLLQELSQRILWRILWSILNMNTQFVLNKFSPK